VKQEDFTIKKEEDLSDSDTEDELSEQDAAVDVNGKKLVDDQGRFLIKICDEEDDSNGNARREFEEIHGIAPGKFVQSMTARSGTGTVRSIASQEKDRAPKFQRQEISGSSLSAEAAHLDGAEKRRPSASAEANISGSQLQNSNRPTACGICSLENDSSSLTCAACSNVLKPGLVPDHWACHRAACGGSQYLNAGDAGACGVCGALRAGS
jgi:hypothetical protein